MHTIRKNYIVIRKILLSLPLGLFFVFTGCEQKTDSYQPEVEPLSQNIYLFGIHPYLNPLDMHHAYAPILRYLENKIGTEVKFQLEASKSYALYEKKLFAGKFAFSLPNPYQTVRSLEYGYKVIAKMAPDDDFRGIYVARKDSGIEKPADLIGKTISFPAPTALAATLMPLYYIHTHGVDVKKEIKPKFVGSQYSSILNAYTKDTAAGATWPPPWRAWQKENPDKAKEMHLLWETEPLPNNGVVARKDIDYKLVEKVAILLSKMSEEREGRALLMQAGFSGFEKAENSTFNPVRSFLITYDQKIGLPK